MRAAAFAAAFIAAGTAASAHDAEKERRRGAEVLREVGRLLHERYHDGSVASRVVAERLARAQAAMSAATSERMAFGIVAALLADLDDSHTFLVPPAAAAGHDWGLTPRMVGERCYVVEVRAGSDAAARGVGVGDEVLAIDGQRPDRTLLWKRLPLARLLDPAPALRLTLRAPGAPARAVTVAAQPVPAGRQVSFPEYLDALRRKVRGRATSVLAERDGVAVWTLAGFDRDSGAISAAVARARRSRGLVLDLRGNAGGDAEGLRRLAGAFFDAAGPLPLATLRDRRGTRPLLAEGWPARRRFQGPLVVLIDSESASAAEVLARTVQLHGRGVVVGDRSAGAVMYARTHVRTVSRDLRLVPYAVSVSEASLLMPDGATLERAGVVPDEIVLPGGDDLRAGRDPALERALQLARGSR